MSTVRELHRTAMDLVDQAWIARHNGEQAQAEELTREALQREREAAELAANRNAPEPSRSVLHRSAAALAYKCGEYQEAERLISVALAGEPPSAIAHELRVLQAQVKFQLYWYTHGPTIDNHSVELTIDGPGTGYGAILSETVSERLRAFQKLVSRTMDRLCEKPYADTVLINRSALLYLSNVRFGSFIATLSIGRPEQIRMEGLSEDNRIVNEVLGCIELLDEGQDKELRKHIGDDAYYRNFIGLVQQLAPDGKSVSMVGLASVKDGEVRRVTLTREKAEIGQDLGLGRPRVEETVTTDIKGSLLFTDALHGDSNDIRIRDENGTAQLIYVPAGMMADIVSPLWGAQVVATVIKVKRKRRLTRIEPL